MIDNRRLLLIERPGDNFLDNPHKVFKLDTEKLSTDIPQDKCLVQNLYASVDPTMRVWMSGIKTYIGVLELGSVMPSLCVAKVVKSTLKGFQPGDLVLTMCGW